MKLCNDYKAGRLKNVDIPKKIIALQCSWIGRLYNNSFHDWKLIPLFLIEKPFYRSFKFHSNVLFKSSKTKYYRSFYWEMNLSWKKHLAMKTEICSCILSQYLWYNVNKSSIQFSRFSEKNIMFHNFLITITSLKIVWI